VKGHAAKVPVVHNPGVAPDVASRSIWAGRRNPDARYFCEIEVAELPWPMRFAFVKVSEEDGSERWACCGLDIGRPIGRAEDGLDSEEFELTPQRWRTIRDNFDRYRLMAERRLIPTTQNIEHASRIRRAMRRRPGERWTREALVQLVADYHALEGFPDGRIWELTSIWKISRTNVWRALKRAEKEGLIQLPRRSASA